MNTYFEEKKVSVQESSEMFEPNPKWIVDKKDVFHGKNLINSVFVEPTGKIRGHGIDGKINFCATFLKIEGVEYFLSTKGVTEEGILLPQRICFVITKKGSVWYLFDSDTKEYYKIPKDATCIIYVESEFEYFLAYRNVDSDKISSAISKTFDPEVAKLFVNTYNYLYSLKHGE